MMNCFWFHTALRDAFKVTLHTEGCRIRARMKDSKGWTGPLTIQQVAIVPITSYRTCKSCRSADVLPAKQRSYGPRKVLSPRQRNQHARMREA